MKSYDSPGIRGYNSNTTNYGARIISNTKIINASYTTLENIRFTFTSTTSYVTFELTWYEHNIYNNGTHWFWWGDAGWWWTGSSLNGRFGTNRTQQGTNNGVGGWSSDTNSIFWNSRTYGVSQNISSLYLHVFCENWSGVTITYS